MCQCTPNIKTPFCGKGNCTWPKQKGFIVTYTEGANPNIDVKIISCETIEDAFLKEVELRNKAFNVNIYRKILLRIELAT